MKNNFVFNFIQIIFTLVGSGMLIAGYSTPVDSLTDDGYLLNNFFYMMGGFFIVWPILLFGTIRFFFRRMAKKIEDLKLNGIKGKARVLSMRNTNVRINHVRQMVLELEITTDFGDKFQASYKECIEPIYYSIIRPDSDLMVYVDATNQKNIHVDFEETWEKLASK